MDESAAPAGSPPPTKTGPRLPDIPTSRPTGPRFPWLPALLCAVALGVAAWTWMRYSYAWDVTPRHLKEAVSESYPDVTGWPEAESFSPEGWPLRGYVCLRGTTVLNREVEEAYPWVEYARYFPGRKLLVHEPDNMRKNVWVHCGATDPASVDGYRGVNGRVYYDPGPVTVDTAASRFHPASITGLVVGAMGVFVFGLYLRTWVRERRAAA